MDWNDKTLSILGLKDIEKKVLSSLTIVKGIKQICQETGFSRTGVVYCLKGLVLKGLVTQSRQKREKYYIALSLEQFSDKLYGIIDVTGNKYKEEKSVKASVSPQNEVIVHVSAKEIISAYQKIVKENKKERILAIQHSRSYREILNQLTAGQLIEFNTAIKKNHLIIDGLLNTSAYSAYLKEIQNHPNKYKEAAKSLEGRMADYGTFEDKLFNYSAEIWIFKDVTLFINWENKIAVEIRDQNITGLLRDMFSFVKAGSKKIDHNEAMRKLLEKTERKPEQN